MTDDLVRRADVLLPCPFCGGEAFLHENDWCEPPEWVVQCGNCCISVSSEVWRQRPPQSAGEGLGPDDARQVRMAVSAWLEGRRDAEFWLSHIHVTLGSPTSDELKRLCQRPAATQQPKKGE